MTHAIGLEAGKTFSTLSLKIEEGMFFRIPYIWVEYKRSGQGQTEKSWRFSEAFPFSTTVFRAGYAVTKFCRLEIAKNTDPRCRYSLSENISPSPEPPPSCPSNQSFTLIWKFTLKTSAEIPLLHGNYTVNLQPYQNKLVVQVQLSLIVTSFKKESRNLPIFIHQRRQTHRYLGMRKEK